jgi:hypothetical protein
MAPVEKVALHDAPRATVEIGGTAGSQASWT